MSYNEKNNWTTIIIGETNMMYIQLSEIANQSLFVFVLICLVGNLFTSIFLAVMAFPTIPQITLWKTLDYQNINLTGKFILCILTIPFTILYTFVCWLVQVLEFSTNKIWKLFCWVFKKKWCIKTYGEKYKE